MGLRDILRHRSVCYVPRLYIVSAEEGPLYLLITINTLVAN